MTVIDSDGDAQKFSNVFHSQFYTDAGYCLYMLNRKFTEPISRYHVQKKPFYQQLQLMSTDIILVLNLKNGMIEFWQSTLRTGLNSITENSNPRFHSRNLLKKMIHTTVHKSLKSRKNPFQRL